MPHLYIGAIEHARVYDIARETPLELAPKLSTRLRNEVLFKREDLQPVFSFKLRGAYNKIAHMSEEECARGVICASAGNHAQGVAMSAKRRGCAATIVMPNTTPDIKVKAVVSMGATVVLHGHSYSDACEHAYLLRDETGLHFVHPYDDPLVIAGQGTIAEEILRQSPKDMDAVFVPVGGGGLISGIAVYLKKYSPDTRVIGVEPVDSAAMYQSIRANKRVTLDQVGIFADGVAVKQVGKHTFDLTRRFVDEIILVDTDEICAAIKDIFNDNRTLVEPAGALGVAGMKKYVAREGVHGQVLVCINSGANMNFDRMRHVAERTEMGEKREALFSVTIPEQPGSFLHFCKILEGRVITEFNYRLSGRTEAHIFVGIGINGERDAEAIQSTLENSHYPVLNLMDNELAKLHIRYLVGGRSAEVHDEVVYRFNFPECPGALLKFLVESAGRWNISLFHYRNHGAAFGCVLAGFEVPEQERNELTMFLDNLGYAYADESANPAYHHFLMAS